MEEDKIELLKSIIENGDCYFLSEKVFFPKEFFQFCFQYGINKVFKWVKPQSTRKNNQYFHWIICKRCGEENKTHSTKTEFKEYIVEFIQSLDNKKMKYSKGEKFICKDCINILQEEKRKENIRIEEEREKRRKERTLYSIQQLLSPNSGPPSFKRKFFWDCYDNIIFSNTEEIARHIQNMPYKDFLNTTYWKILSWYVKVRSDSKCRLCGSNQNLNAHHPTYNRHGYEMQDWRELLCLCKKCHVRHHLGGK